MKLYNMNTNFYQDNKNRGNNKRSKNKNTKNNKNNNNNKNNKLAKVYQDTLEHIEKNNLYPTLDSILYDVNDLPEFDKLEPNDNIILEVKNTDTLDMACLYIDLGLNPMVLNMASDYKAGGGVRSGRTAQEECLFRRTNASATHPNEFYPLKFNEVVYSPEVLILKNKNHQYLKHPKPISLISVPALRKPQLIYKKYGKMDYDIMTAKIESIFKIAILNKHDSLVLGALGCGVFKNPIHEVASIFRTMINYYGGYFKYIGFAVLTNNDNTDQNFIILNRTIKTINTK